MSQNADQNKNVNSETLDRQVKEVKKQLPEAAKRALAEAEERRRLKTDIKPDREIGGRGGADPARFGDWEIDGRAIDF